MVLYVIHQSLFFSGKTDPYVILSLGDQIIRSKKNSQTTVIGSPGEPIWNQVKLISGFCFTGEYVPSSVIFGFIYVLALIGVGNIGRISICLLQILGNRNCISK